MSAVFLQSASILLREGLEALLVIAALAAYLSRVGAGHRLLPLYMGAGLAILASIVAAWLFETFNNGAHNDLMEAATILAAAALMLFVSGWLFIRQDPRAWQGYLRAKADHALAKDNSIAIAVLAFLAVFREGAETVLFVHALATTSGGWSVALLGGLLAAALALAVLFGIINTVARRLPMRFVFVATSAFLFVTAIKFIGQAIQELQEQQIVPYDEVAGGSWLSAIGFNPTLEAVSVQAAVMLIAIVSVVLLERRARRAPAGTAAVS
jgi:high-affinity iron transporter